MCMRIGRYQAVLGSSAGLAAQYLPIGINRRRNGAFANLMKRLAVASMSITTLLQAERRYERRRV